MAIIVQKFGGSSVATTEKIKSCAKRAIHARDAGNQIVIVVSAMGDTTDHLIELARAIADAPHKREIDMLLATGEQVSIALMTMALHAQGVDAISMTGGQLGIVTDEVHTKAKIRSINADRIRDELSRGRIIVAAGFQGTTSNGDITTLGRGGSDTTAVALAAALRVQESGGVCEIYTDVDGIYTADPRRVRNARKLDRISYEEMLELASLGAAVMHNRAVTFGQKYNVPIHVRHSAMQGGGTLIVRETLDMEDIAVVGCALKQALGRISLRRVPNRPGTQALIFRHIAEANIVVDDIMQTEYGDTASISFTVDHPDLAEVKVAAGKALEEIGTGELAIEIGLAKVSAVGAGMQSQPGVAATMFQALGDAGIPIHNISTSEIKISCILPQQHGERALQIVHDAFRLGEERG
jgi:aspartate kinase